MRDLLAEVERAPAREGLLVRPVDRCDLAPAHDLERGPIRHVAGTEPIHLRALLGRQLPAPHRGAAARDGATRLAVRDLVGSVFIGLETRPLVTAQSRVRAAHVANGTQVAVGDEACHRIGVAAVSVLEDALLLSDEGVETCYRREEE